MNEKEKVLRALANKRRLAIVKYLKSKEEATVSDISEEIKLSFRSTSRHLAILFATSIVARTQKGLEVYYRLFDFPSPFASSILRLI